MFGSSFAVAVAVLAAVTVLAVVSVSVFLCNLFYLLGYFSC